MTALHKGEEWLETLGCGVILRRVRRLQRTARLGGPDLKRAPPAELVGMGDRINDSLRALGPGWLVLIQTGRDVTRVVGPLTVSNAISRHFEAAYQRPRALEGIRGRLAKLGRHERDESIEPGEPNANIVRCPDGHREAAVIGRFADWLEHFRRDLIST